jgi:hypothetical protein
MSVDEDRKRDRSEAPEDAPAKWVNACANTLHQVLTSRRPRAEAKKEDRARGKRLFGNILGTLQQFKKEDKTARTSEAVSWPPVYVALRRAHTQAKRREQVKERIENKIRSEASLHTDIAETDRELKGLRIHTESLEYVLKHKEAAVSRRALVWAFHAKVLDARTARNAQADITIPVHCAPAARTASVRGDASQHFAHPAQQGPYARAAAA